MIYNKWIYVEKFRSRYRIVKINIDGEVHIDKNGNECHNLYNADFYKTYREAVQTLKKFYKVKFHSNYIIFTAFEHIGFLE